MEKLSENKGKYYFLFKKKIFYSDIKYDYKLSIKIDAYFDKTYTSNKKSFPSINLDNNNFNLIISLFNPYSDYTYTNIEKSDIIIYDLCNKLTYLYYGCYLQSIGDNQISIHSDYMEIVEDPDLIKSNIRDYKLNNLLDNYIEQL